jgi:hypothetical protein
MSAETAGEDGNSNCDHNENNSSNGSNYNNCHDQRDTSMMLVDYFHLGDYMRLPVFISMTGRK